jgi:hypothetical protein
MPNRHPALAARSRPTCLRQGKSLVSGCNEPHPGIRLGRSVGRGLRRRRCSTEVALLSLDPWTDAHFSWTLDRWVIGTRRNRSQRPRHFRDRRDSRIVNPGESENGCLSGWLSASQPAEGECEPIKTGAYLGCSLHRGAWHHGCNAVQSIGWWVRFGGIQSGRSGEAVGTSGRAPSQLHQRCRPAVDPCAGG